MKRPSLISKFSQIRVTAAWYARLLTSAVCCGVSMGSAPASRPVHAEFMRSVLGSADWADVPKRQMATAAIERNLVELDFMASTPQRPKVIHVHFGL